MCEIDDFGGNDLIGWHEWPTNRREPMQAPCTDLPPIHEPEPGLLDEEILPLRDDWMRGPAKAPCIGTPFE